MDMRKYKIMWLVMLVLPVGCIEEDYFGKSSFNKMLSFSLPQQIDATVIDHDKREIYLTVSDEADVTAMVPAVLVVSNFAKVTPGKEQIMDFSKPVVYTVTAESGTSVDYTVFVKLSSPEIQLPNSSFDQWYITKGGYQQIGVDADDKVWCTGNEGVVTMGSANALPLLVDNETVAQLTTLQLGSLAQLVGQGIAAGSLFTGTFKLNLSNPAESPQFGTPFVARPKSFSVEFRYRPGDELMNGKGKVIPGKDSVEIAVWLEDRSSEPWKRVATAWYRSEEATPEWSVLQLPLQYGQLPSPKYFEIPAKGVWGSGTETPTHLTVVFSSSARGALFEGAPGSELLVNDFKLVY